MCAQQIYRIKTWILSDLRGRITFRPLQIIGMGEEGDAQFRFFGVFFSDAAAVILNFFLETIDYPVADLNIDNANR